MKGENVVWHEAISLVPHRPPMLFVDFVRTLGQDKAEAKTKIKEEWVILDQHKHLPGLSFFEIIAQSYAAMTSLHLRSAGKKNEGSLGFLVGLKNFLVHGAANVGEELFIKVSTKASIGSFAVVDGEVFRADTLLATGQIKIFSPYLQA